MPGFKRVLRWPEGAALTLAAVLGSGILYLPALTADLAGPGAVLAWVGMGLLSVPFALTLVGLSERLPDAGGIAAYARDAFGPDAGAIAGWYFLIGGVLGPPIVVLIGVGYVSALVGLSPAATALAAWLLALPALILNWRGVQLSGRAAAGVVAAIAAVMVAAAAAGAPHVRAAAFGPFLPHGLAPLGLDAALLYWAFIGWESVVHYAEEFVDPARDMRRAVGLAVVVVNVLYLAVVVVTIGAGAYGGGRNADSLAVLMGLGLGQGGRAAAAALAVLVCYGTTHAYVGSISRLIYAQARAGDFPRYFAVLSPKLGTPARVIAGMALAFAAVLGVDALWPFSVSALLAWLSALIIALYLLAMAAGYRRLSGRWPRTLAAIGFLASLAAMPFLGWTALFPVGIVLAHLIWRRALGGRGAPVASPGGG